MFTKLKLFRKRLDVSVELADNSSEQVSDALILKRRVGASLMELLMYIVIAAILAAAVISGAASLRGKAQTTTSVQTIQTYTDALQAASAVYPEIMKFTPTKPSGAIATLVEHINQQLDEQYRLEVLPGQTGSGLVAYSKIARDAWNNPFGLYVYFNDKRGTYNDSTGAPLSKSSSCIYMVIMSAGRNGTGGPVGYDGDNFDPATRDILSPANAVNNTDGIDDVGTIVRIMNGDIYVATFGQESSVLGDLKNTQWILGVPDVGICYDYEGNTQKTAISGGSIDEYPNALAITNDTTNRDYCKWN